MNKFTILLFTILLSSPVISKGNGSSHDLIYTFQNELNTEGQKIIIRLRTEIEAYNFQYDISKIKSDYDIHPIVRAAYLKGFIQGYMWGKQNKETSFPFSNEDQKLIPAMINGYFSGQYHGLRGEEPQ